ncbi:hypothetical protein QQ054_11075 [Oscillatoria amoena NRMC-F 0135]|nr:hypothetical protein [Oscillatoria laete-virens]MDL5046575.1 hypothetical protein [Oscillatoria amoena NRMC-F 0135]MDL5053565.1 hypothetical protein [Oscillatoria laete-virens NRMC-F 0139]
MQFAQPFKTISLFCIVTALFFSFSLTPGLIMEHIHHGDEHPAEHLERHHATDNDESGKHAHLVCCLQAAAALPAEVFCFFGDAATFRAITVIHDSIPDGPARLIDHPPQLS